MKKEIGLKNNNLLSMITLITLFFATIMVSTQMTGDQLPTNKWSPDSPLQVGNSIDQLTTDKWSTEWRPYGGYVDEINFKVFTEAETPLAMQALLGGEIDAYDKQVPREYQEALLEDPDITVPTTLNTRYRALVLNCEKFPTSITRYRRAIAFGMDKDRINQLAIDGAGEPLDSHIPWCATEWEVESIVGGEFYDKNIEAGNASLEAAGFKDLDGDVWREYDANGDGIFNPIYGDKDDDACSIDFYATAGYEPAIITCVLAVEGLNEMGMRAQIVEMDFEVMLDEMVIGNHWAACWSEEGVPIINPGKSLYKKFNTNGQWNTPPTNYYHYSNPTLDAVLDQMAAATDLDAVKAKAREAGKMLADEQPVIVAYEEVNINAYRTDEFEGFPEFSGLGSSSGKNPYVGTKVRLKDALGGPYGPDGAHVTFDYCLSGPLTTLNPYLQSTDQEATLFQNIYEKLWNVDPNTWDPIPGLAYDWDLGVTTAGTDGWMLDGESYTFYLYENETWHDGKQFNAEDVNHSIYMWRNSPYHGPEMWDIYNTTIQNPFEITFYVTETGFFEFVDTTNFYITPEHIWDEVTDVSTYEPPVDEVIGTGPYMMNRVLPSGVLPSEFVLISLLRDPNWRWEILAQYITQIIIEEIDDLVDDGDLNQGQGRSLQKKLENVIRLIEDGKTKAAREILQAFINSVNDFINTGKLSMEEGQALITQVQQVLLILARE